MKKYFLVVFSYSFIFACTNPNVKNTPNFGSNLKSDCVQLTQDLEKDLKLVNPENKTTLNKEDLGVGTDSYLEYRFTSNDIDKNLKLDLNELKNYLGNINQATLGGFCRKV